MPQYSRQSKDKLDTCNHRLIKIANKLIKFYDNTVVFGFRDHETQERLFKEGKSKLHFPNSGHNHYPSRAMDLQPYPYPYNKERDEFMFMRGLVYAIAHELGIKLKPTITWDLFHFELAESERDNEDNISVSYSDPDS